MIFSTINANRTFPPHVPNLINRDVMYNMEIDFGPEMKRTSGHKLRSYNDLQFQFMYNNYLIESPHNYQFKQIDDSDHVGYCDLTNNYWDNLWSISKTRSERKKFICINDDINHEWDSIWTNYTYELIDNFYNEFYPNKSQFEL